MIADLFAGPGGWSEGLRSLDPAAHTSEVGFEWDDAACRTRAAAGHRSIRCDVADYPLAPLAGKVDGLIASPPCQDFSQAGNRVGITGARGQLVTEVLRWAFALRPRWIVCEQVPPALGIWDMYAHELRAVGYSAWSGVLNAADYGVPQTRRRAFLIASLDRPAVPPAPTHAQDPAPGGDLFGDELMPWVTMAEALGWGMTVRVGFPRLDDLGTSPDGYRERDWRGADEPSFALTEKARSWVIESVNTGRDWKPGGTRADAQTVPTTEPAPTVTGKSGEQWHLNPGRTDTQPNRRTYPLSEPAPTIAFGHDAANWCWEDRFVRGAPADPSWPSHRPATTLAGDQRVAQPGHKNDKASPDSPGRMQGAIRLEVPEALVLQSFRADYPVQGTRSQQFQQVGNAVPPQLAAAVLSAVL